MISTYASGIQTGTIGVENFLSSPNVPGIFILHVDLSNMVLGDYTEIRRYKMVINSGTSRVIDVQTYQGAQPSDLLIATSEEVWNSLIDANAVRFSLKQTLGTARAYSWSVVYDDGIMGIATGTFLDALADKVWDEQLGGHLVTGSTGKALNSAQSAGDPWSTAIPGAYTPGQAGYIVGTYVDTYTSSRMASGTVFVGDKTGFSLVSPQRFDLIGNISGTITNVYNVISGTTSTLDASQVWNFTGTRSLNGQQYWNLSGTVLNVNNVVNPVGLLTGTLIDAISDVVWDEQISGHLITGSTGKALNSASAGGDPWGTALPDGYGAGTAGYILGNNLDARVSSRMASGTVSVQGLNPALLDVAVSSRQPSGTVVVATNQDKTGYSLATGTNIPANVKQINDTNVTGNGSTTPWGPA